MKRSKALRELADKGIDVDTRCRIAAPPEAKAHKWQGQAGTIIEWNFPENPIPTIELDSGTRLAVELKHLKFNVQTSLV